MFPQEKEDQQHDHKRNDNADLHLRRNQHAFFVHRTKPFDLNAFLENIHQILGSLLRVDAENGDHAAGKEHTRQGNDKGLNLQMRDQEALYRAEGQADQNRHNNRKHNSSGRCKVHRCDQAFKQRAVENHDADHGDKCRYAADGNIDAAGDHDNRQSAGDNDQECIVVEHVEEHLRFLETAAPDQNSRHIHDKENADCNGQKELGIGHGFSAPGRKLIILGIHALCLLSAEPPVRIFFMS